MGALDISRKTRTSLRDPYAPLRGDMADQWGRRLRELSSSDLARETFTDPLGGIEADGILRACVVRYACSNDEWFGRAHPADVDVSVDLATGAWETTQGETGTDLVSLVRWCWHGSTTATSRFARSLPTESLIVALLGLTALDLSRSGGLS